jgi:hypothetical protein
VIKESAIAELARSVTSGGAVVLSAGGTPFVRSRARGGPVGDAGGALELREADLAGAVVLDETEAPAAATVLDGGNLVPEYRYSLLHTSGGDVVLATAARHDLIAEASGGAEPGTAVTAETPIDVLAHAAVEFAADDTFTLALLPGPDAPGAEAGGAHADAVRGGAWVERFVNELGLAPEDQNPNAKIKIKI